RDQATTRAYPRLRPLQLAEVGDYTEAPRAVEAQPRALRLQVAPGEHAGRRRPLGERRGGARVELVAVGGHHEAVARMRLPGEHQEAHGVSRRPAASPR